MRTSKGIMCVVASRLIRIANELVANEIKSTLAKEGYNSTVRDDGGNHFSVDVEVKFPRGKSFEMSDSEADALIDKIEGILNGVSPDWRGTFSDASEFDELDDGTDLITLYFEVYKK